MIVPMIYLEMQLPISKKYLLVTIPIL